MSRLISIFYVISISLLYFNLEKVNSSFPKWLGEPLSRYFDSSNSKEFRLSQSSFSQYHEKIREKIASVLARFQQKQKLREKLLRSEFNEYRNRFQNFTAELNQRLQQQQNILKDLNIQSKRYHRPKMFDRSLEDFQRVFNESSFNNFFSGTSTPTTAPSWTRKRFSEFETFSKQLDKMNEQIIYSYHQLQKRSKESRIKTEQLLKSTLRELVQYQENLLKQSKLLEQSTSEVLPKALTKEEILRIRDVIEKKLEKLENDSTTWIEMRKTTLEQQIKRFQEKLNVSDAIYEDFLGKKKASIHYTIMNDITLKKVLTMIDDRDPGWKLIKSEEGCNVYRKFMSSGLGSQYACVKCTGIVNAPPKKVFDLFEDNTRVREYNTLFDEGRDLEVVAENTKITWASSTPIFPFKPRDFCTIVHTRKLQDGTFIVLNRAITHPDAPVTNRYTRGSIILAANIIRPVKGNSRSCHLTMITQVDPGGFAPPMIINHLCALGPIGFMKNIRIAANRKPSKKVLEEKKRIALLKEKKQNNK